MRYLFKILVLFSFVVAFKFYLDGDMNGILYALLGYLSIGFLVDYDTNGASLTCEHNYKYRKNCMECTLSSNDWYDKYIVDEANDNVRIGYINEQVIKNNDARIKNDSND
jgi:hypothetical protein